MYCFIQKTHQCHIYQMIKTIRILSLGIATVKHAAEAGNR